MNFDVAAVRRQFPILSEIIDGRPVHYLDNGASAQTPLAVLDAVRSYETSGRANVTDIDTPEALAAWRARKS